MVIVGSLDFDNPDTDPVGSELGPYCRRSAFEPADRITAFDHARQHYVAFSRPKGLLVLTSRGPVHPRFQNAWQRLPRWSRMDRRSLARQRFRPPDQAGNWEGSPQPAQTIPYLKRLDVWVGHAAPVARTASPEPHREEETL